MTKFAACLVLVCVLAISAPAQTPEAEKLHSLFARDWQRTLESNPTFASFLGDKRYNSRWPDLSLEVLGARNRQRIETLAELEGMDRAKLSISDRVNYDLFRNSLESAIENFNTRLYLLPISQRGGIQTADELGDQLIFSTVRDYEDWIARLNAFAVYADQTLALMRAGRVNRMIWSKQVLVRVPAQLDKQIVDDPEQSPF